MKTPALLAALMLAACSAAPKPPPLRTVDHVDLERYMGDWHVLGTIPWFLEKNNVGTMDIYRMRPDGKIDVTYAFHKKSLDAPRREMKAVARVVDTESNAEWRVRFLWPFEAPFLVIDLTPDYRFTTVGYPDRSLIWIMGREPRVSGEDYARLLENAAAQGYDVSRIVRVPQRAGGGD